MKRTVSVLLVFILSFTVVSNGMFTDTKNHWASDYINSLAMEGVINGINENEFYPDTFVTREQFLKMLLLVTSDSINERVSYETPPIINEIIEKSPFSDVSADRWSYYYIKKAMDRIIFSEEYGDRFEPIKDITREEAAVWMTRALSLNGGTAEFTDNDRIKNAAAVGAAAANGLITGFEDGSFRPDGALTRAQAAVMLKRAGALKGKLKLNEMNVAIDLESVDMDGDGAAENIKIVHNGISYVLCVNDMTAIGGESDASMLAHYAVDINTADKYMEIAVVENAFGLGALAIYRYTGDTLYLMGYIESAGGIDIKPESGAIGSDWGAVSINNDGTVTGNIGVQYVHTMLVRKQFSENSKNRLAAESNEFYTVGSYSEFTGKELLTSTKTDTYHQGITVAPGYAGKIVKTDLKNWIYIETGSGEAGWIYIEDDGLIKGEPLSYYLEGLWYAG